MKRFLIIGILISITTATLFSTGKKWEYLVCDYPDYFGIFGKIDEYKDNLGKDYFYPSDFNGDTYKESVLDALGKDGWELITIYPQSHSLQAVFKRPYTSE